MVTFEENWMTEDVGRAVERIGAADTRDPLVKEICRVAKKAFGMMECHGYIRVDVREKRGRPYLLEVNINPGLGWDEQEDVRVSAEAAGLEFFDIIRMIIEAAV